MTGRVDIDHLAEDSQLTITCHLPLTTIESVHELRGSGRLPVQVHRITRECPICAVTVVTSLLIPLKPEEVRRDEP